MLSSRNWSSVSLNLTLSSDIHTQVKVVMAEHLWRYHKISTRRQLEDSSCCIPLLPSTCFDPSLSYSASSFLPPMLNSRKVWQRLFNGYEVLVSLAFVAKLNTWPYPTPNSSLRPPLLLSFHLSILWKWQALTHSMWTCIAEKWRTWSTNVICSGCMPTDARGRGPTAIAWQL